MHCPHERLKFTKFYISDTKDKDDRLERIRKIGNLRMAQPSDSAYRMERICVGLPEGLEPHHGYHRDCYQRFTANIKRLQFSEKLTEPSYGKRVKRRGLMSLIRFYSHRTAFFVTYDRKKIKVKESWTTEALSSFEYGGGVTIVREADGKKNEKPLNRFVVLTCCL